MKKYQYYGALDAIKLSIESAVTILQCPIMKPDGDVMESGLRLSDDNIKHANMTLAKAQIRLRQILDIDWKDITNEDDDD